MPTTTALTLARLRRCGYTATVCETWVPKVERRRDLFGVGDVIACHPVRREVLLVQCTVLAHVGDRLTRVRQRPELRSWLESGGLFQCWGWYRLAERWDVKIVRVDATDLRDVLVTAPPRRGRRPKQRGLFDLAEV